jgi:uncharacterized protein (DUF2141 family)
MRCSLRVETFRTTALALIVVAVGAATASAADLTVRVKDVRDAKGSVLISIYDSQANFLKPQLANWKQKLKASKGEVVFVFHDVPAGTYAATSFQDEDDSGKLKSNSLGVPTEGYGFSNDAQGTGGPPKFAQAAFDFDGKADKTISFSLNY